MRRSIVAWAMSVVLVAGSLFGCSSKSGTGEAGDKVTQEAAEQSQEDAPRALSIPQGSAGTVMSTKQGSDVLDIVRAQPSGTKPADVAEDTWTIFVYLCGSDLESMYGSATDNLADMVGASGSEHVRFVVQTGGAESWSYEDIDVSRFQRLYIENGSIMEVDSVPATDMGKPSTLADFLVWGVENYPSDHMGVILWNHGGGSVSGVCFDERENYDALLLPDLDEAFSTTFEHMWQKFDFVGFDACLMSTIECANVMATYADYLYASQETEPSTGWDYVAITEYLAQNPTSDGEGLGEVVCDSYIDSIDDEESQQGATFAITDLTRVDDLLQAFNRFSSELFTATEDSQVRSEFVRSVLAADNFGGNNAAEGYTNMVDLLGVAQSGADLCPSAADVASCLQDAVVYKREGQVHANAGGLSVYYPLQISDADELTVFERVCVSPYYLSYVDRQAQAATFGEDATYDDDTWFSSGTWGSGLPIQIGANGADNHWNYVSEHTGESSYITFADKPQLDEDGIYWFKLDENALENTATVSALVYNMSEDGKDMIALGETFDVNADWDTGEFFDQFDGYWLSLPDGQNLCIYIADWTDDYTVFTCPISLNGKDCFLRVRVYNDSTVVVEGAWDGIGEAGEASRNTYDLKPGDVIIPLYDSFAVEDSAEGSYTGREYTVDDDFYVLYDLLSQGTYYYEFCIEDIYGDYLVTDAVVFGVDENGELTFEK